MKKVFQIAGVLVLIVVLVLVFRRAGEESMPVEPKSVAEVVAELQQPIKLPSEPVQLSTLTFETIKMLEEVTEEVTEENTDEVFEIAEFEAPVKVWTRPAVRVSPEQVLAVVNGRPLTGRQLMPPGRYKKNGTSLLPAEVLQETIESAIQRELILQQAEEQGLVLPDRQQAQLGGMYKHLTGNPLILPEGQEVLDFSDAGDAMFHVREQAARLLQIELLKQAGESDTAQARLALRAQLKSEATIEIVDTRPAAGE